MNRIVFAAVFAIAASSPALAQSEGCGPAATPASAVDDLTQYGNRFDKAIRLIETASQTPDWGWEDRCDEGRELMASDE